MVTTIGDRVPECSTRLNAHTSQEEYEAHLAEHQVGTVCGVSRDLKLVAESSDKDTEHQRATSQTELYGFADSGDRNRNLS